MLSRAEDTLDKVRAAGGVARPQGNRGSSADAPANDDPPKCRECGSTMTYREGTSKAGKDYKGYFCPNRDCSGELAWVNG